MTELHDRPQKTAGRPTGRAIPASGALLWRHTKNGRLKVLLIHRPRYDDWSWPKGKVDAGESLVRTAVREVKEETGLDVAIGRPLPNAQYQVLDNGAGLAMKTVHYWAARVVGGKGLLEHEVDQVAWLDADAAHDRLDYAHDREQLRALVRADQEGRLDTWPLVIVRHATAVPRSDWREDDYQRPLNEEGSRQARALVPILRAYRIKRLISSSSARCVDTLSPYAVRVKQTLRLREDLSEETFEAHPKKATRRLKRVLRKDTPAAICAHGPVIPDLLSLLQSRLVPEARDGVAGLALDEAIADKMVKGEALVAHIVGVGKRARVVAVERHRP